MRLTQRIWVAVGLVGSLALLEPEGRGECTKRCPPEKRDASGCCPAPKASAMDKQVICAAGLVLIPSGSFMMGSEDGVGNPNEHPQHRVSVKAFCLDKTEVTVARYAACVASGMCTTAGTDLPNCNANRSERQDHPINCVDWNQARAFCTSAGGRLPAETEWEYAARGAKGSTYPWGEKPASTQLCWNRRDSNEGTCKVGSYPAGNTPLGVQDMAGNVWEWVEDLYCAPHLSNDCPVNVARVIRGGCWDDYAPSRVRSALRAVLARSERGSSLGFRCARDIEPAHAP